MGRTGRHRRGPGLLAVAAVLLLGAAAAPSAPRAAACPPVPFVRRHGPPAPRGRLSLDTTPWARVRIDGHAIGVTPIFGRYLDPGPHRIELRTSCGRFTRRVHVPAGYDLRLRWSLCLGRPWSLPRYR